MQLWQIDAAFFSDNRADDPRYIWTEGQSFDLLAPEQTTTSAQGKKKEPRNQLPTNILNTNALQSMVGRLHQWQDTSRS